MGIELKKVAAVTLKDKILSCNPDMDRITIPIRFYEFLDPGH